MRAALSRLRSRVATIADPANHQRLGWAVVVRWLTIVGFSLLALLAWAIGALAPLLPCIAAGTAAAAVNALNHWCVRRGRGVAAITAVAIPADVVLTTYLIAATGGLGSPFVMLYVVAVVATAMLVDLWVAASVAVAAAGGLTGALWLGLAAPSRPPVGAAQQAVWGLFLLYGLALMTFVGGYVSARLRETARRLRATEAQLVQSEKLRASPASRTS